MSTLDDNKPVIHCKWLSTCKKTIVDGYCLLYRDFLVCPTFCALKEPGTPIDLETLIGEGFNPYCKHIEFYPKDNQLPDICCSLFHTFNPKCLEQCQFSEKVKSISLFLKEEYLL